MYTYYFSCISDVVLSTVQSFNFTICPHKNAVSAGRTSIVIIHQVCVEIHNLSPDSGPSESALEPPPQVMCMHIKAWEDWLTSHRPSLRSQRYMESYDWRENCLKRFKKRKTHPILVTCLAQSPGSHNYQFKYIKVIEIVSETPLRYIGNGFKMVQCRHPVWYFHLIFSSG